MTRHTSAAVILVALSLGFTAVSLKLVLVQLFNHEYYVKLADANHIRKRTLSAKRGPIVDTHGSLLASTLVKFDLRMDCKDFKKNYKDTYNQIFVKLADILGMPLNALIELYNKESEVPKPNRWLMVAKDLTPDQVDAVKKLKVVNLAIEERMVREYPLKELASHVTGYLDNDGIGSAGVEKEAEQLLAGVPGYQEVETDNRRREIAAYSSHYQAPKEGNTVVLTIDAVIQNAVEEELNSLVAENKPKAAYVVVMRPKTGEVLAMANWPTIDFNNRKNMTPENVRNRCITDSFEPGSTFKIIPMAAALNEKLVKPQTMIFCENGNFFYAGHTLRDHAPYGMLSVHDIIKVSSNIGTGKVAMLLGPDQMYFYCQLFGINQQTGLFSKQGEAAGILHSLNRWHKISIVQVPMGQGVTATALQMTQAMGVIANGGRFAAPQIIKEIRDSNNEIIKPFQPNILRQVVRPEVAQQITDALSSVVDDEGGTGSLARLDGWTAAGKTGTAQKAVNGVYAKGKYVASFIGFVPARNPEFVVSVIVDEPTGASHYGGAVSGPTFKRISERVARYLNIPQDQPSRLPEPVQVKGQKPLPEPTRPRAQQATL